MICSNDMCSFEIGKDRSPDPRRLGRWTSMTFEGKMNAKITMITAYCPVNNTNGLHSAFTQQLVYINKNKDKHPANHNDYIPQEADSPRKLFEYDIMKYITTLQDIGHTVWVLGDFNAEYDELRSWMAKVHL